jgi:HlyD family secretion protein
MLVLQNVAPAGVIVKKGDQVAEFDRQYMLLRLDDYQASVVQSEASLKKRGADLDISHKAHEQLVSSAKGALEKARLDLKTIPVLSDIDGEKARLAFQQAEAKYQQLLKEVPFVLASEQADTRNSEINVEKAKQEQKRAQMNADKMIAKAPIDGLVVMQSMFRGADFGQIQQGDQLYPGMFYMQIVDPRSMVINATMNQSDVEQVRIGQKARVHFDAYPDLTLPAHVESVAAVAKPGMFRPTFFREVAVRLRLDQMDSRVIPDLSVSAEIQIESDAQVSAAAPLGAVFQEAAVSGDGNSSKAYVFVKTANGWERREVEVGIHNNLVAAVKSGLKAGEVVAIDRPPQFSTGSPEISQVSP